MNEIITVSDLASCRLNLRWMSANEMLRGHRAGMFAYRMEPESPVDDLRAPNA